MYGSTREDFQKQMKPFIQNAPLQAARPGIDDEQYIKDADPAGGRPGYDYEIAGKCNLKLSFFRYPVDQLVDSVYWSECKPSAAIQT